MLERALYDWQEYSAENLHMSINVPPSYLSQTNCLAKLKTFMKRYQAKGLKLCVEITERQLLDNSDRAILADIQKLGIDVSIDDFGTGYTSLSILQETEFNYLKIDRCFINTIGFESVNAHVLNTIINLADSMQVTMIAEGVETQEQADYLREHGVQLLQGYFFHRPMAAEEVNNLLQQ